MKRRDDGRLDVPEDDQLEQYAPDDVRFDAPRLEVLEAEDDIRLAFEYAELDDVSLTSIFSTLFEFWPIISGIGVKVFLHTFPSTVEIF